MVNFNFSKPPRDRKVKETVADLVKEHGEARRDLSDTLSQTGQFEARQIMREMKEEARKAYARKQKNAKA